MVEIFKALGIRSMFLNPSDLSGIVEGEDAVIDSIIHKAVIEVNEVGAEAAATTVVGGRRSVSIPEPPFHFVADRPFYFDIRDTKTGATLFVGVVRDL
jgi:serpin B